MAKEFTKNIKLNFDVNKIKYNQVNQLLKHLQKDMKLTDDEDVKRLSEMVGKAKELGGKLEIKDVKETLERLKTKGLVSKADLTPFQKENQVDAFAKGFKDSLDQKIPKWDPKQFGADAATFAVNKVSEGLELLKETFKQSFEKLNQLLSTAYLSNAQTRENLFMYGMSASESYGLSRALEFVGISDIEDVMWLNADQQKAFQDKLLLETKRYEKLYDSGYFKTLQQFQYDMANFRDDVEYEFMNFFIENKDTIMKLMELTAYSARTGVKILSKLVGGIGVGSTMSDAQRSAQTKELIYGKGNTTNVNIDNTFNNVAKSDQTWLANAGEMTYEQLIRALKKGTY